MYSVITILRLWFWRSILSVGALSCLPFNNNTDFFAQALYRKTAQASGIQDCKHSWEEGHTKGTHRVHIQITQIFTMFNFCFIFCLLQKLKDVAFPQAEILKKALLRRFEQEHEQYLVKKVKCLLKLHLCLLFLVFADKNIIYNNCCKYNIIWATFTEQYELYSGITLCCL